MFRWSQAFPDRFVPGRGSLLRSHFPFQPRVIIHNSVLV